MRGLTIEFAQPSLFSLNRTKRVTVNLQVWRMNNGGSSDERLTARRDPTSYSSKEPPEWITAEGPIKYAAFQNVGPNSVVLNSCHIRRGSQLNILEMRASTGGAVGARLKTEEFVIRFGDYTR
jgi:hypothetical protein